MSKEEYFENFEIVFNNYIKNMKEIERASEILGIDKESDIYKKRCKKEENQVKVFIKFMIDSMIPEYKNEKAKSIAYKLGLMNEVRRNK